MKKFITLFLLIVISINYLSIIENICFLHKCINKKESLSFKKTFNTEDSEKDTDDETGKNLKEKCNEKYVSLHESLVNLFLVNSRKQNLFFSVQLISPPFIDKDGPPPNVYA